MSATIVPSVLAQDDAFRVLRERTQMKGTEAMMNNIAAAHVMCAAVRTSLGPHGMDKMLVSDQDVVTVTNDGATMLKEMKIQHPAGRILAEVSKATDSGVGDGTTSAVVFAGALLEGADELLKRGFHPIVLVGGYQRAAKKAYEILEGLAEKIDPTDKETLVRAARVSLQSKIASRSSLDLADLVVRAVLMVAARQPSGTYRVDVKSIKVDKKIGGSMADTTLVEGIILDQKIAQIDVPKRLENARIALVNTPFTIEPMEFKSMATITEASQLVGFLNSQAAVFRRMVAKLKELRVDVIICQKAIDEEALDFLAKAGIVAVQKAWEYEMPNISRATGAVEVDHLDDLQESDIGYAKVVEERKLEQDRMLFLEGTKGPRSVTILVRGANKKVTEEAERSIHDAIMVVKDLLQEPQVVVGGGATEAEIAYRLSRWADTLEDKEQFAVQKYAEALEQIPAILAENAGLDTINTTIEIRAKHAEGGEGKWYGVPATGKKTRNLRQEFVLEPLAVKRQVLMSATEAVCMLLRIDNIIALPPDKDPHMGSPEIADSIAAGHRPLLAPSSLATQT